jgi:glycosyltransferase involved in cell wall biosynthesis
VKIALCTDGIYPHALGGMQRHSRLLAEHLARTPGIELVVIHPHAQPVFDPALGIHEEQVSPMDEGRLYLRELYRYSDRVAGVLDRIKPDAILSQGFCVWKGMVRFSERLIVMPHGLEMFQGLTLKDRAIGLPFRRALRYVVRRSTITVSLGGKLTPILQGLAEGSAARIVVLPNAVELPATSPAYPQRDAPLELLFVGRFAFNKGIDVLLRVANRLCDEGRADVVHFTLAGDGPERARMEQVGLPANVSLAGRVDDAQLEQLFAKCHALVLPTRFEGMPTVVLEAMARSRPVVVSDVGASAELVDGLNGFLLPPSDETALYEALVRMADLDRAAREAMGTAGRKKVEAGFTWPAVTKRFVELCATIAQRV